MAVKKKKFSPIFDLFFTINKVLPFLRALFLGILLLFEWFQLEAMEEIRTPEAEPPVLHTNSLSDLVNPVLVGIFIVLNFTGKS